MSETERVPYVVRRSEAEEIIEHRAFDTAEHKQVTILALYGTNAWFALTIKQRDMKEALEWRVNIAASRHTTSKTLVILATSLCSPLSHFLKGFHEYNSPLGVPVLHSTQLQQRLHFFERCSFIYSDIIYRAFHNVLHDYKHL
jgi:hypothetical protein